MQSACCAHLGKPFGKASTRYVPTLTHTLDTYNLEVWSILHKQDTCTASVKELDEVLAVEESTNEEAEMRDE